MVLVNDTIQYHAESTYGGILKLA